MKKNNEVMTEVVETKALFMNGVRKAAKFEKDIIEFCNDPITCKLLNRFFAKIVIGFLVSRFNEEVLNKFAEAAECDDIDEFLYGITCAIDNRNLEDVIVNLENTYPDCWNV